MASTRSRSTSVNGDDTSVDTVVSDLHAENAENAELRERVTRLEKLLASRTGADLAPAPQQVTTTVRGGWEDYPEHDPEYVAAAVRFGTGSEQAREALSDAKNRIAERKAQQRGMPGRPGDYERLDRAAASHADRRAMGQAGLDMTGLPVEPGGVMTQHESGQITIRHRPERTCPSGHPAESDTQNYCTTCGAPVGSPGLGEPWSSIPEQDRDLAAERRAAEAGYDPAPL